MAFFLYEDRPGVIGTVGTLLGEAGINIAAMEVGRRAAGGHAVMGMAVDSPIPAATLAEIERVVGAERARALLLPAEPSSLRQGGQVAHQESRSSSSAIAAPASLASRANRLDSAGSPASAADRARAS